MHFQVPSLLDIKQRIVSFLRKRTSGPAPLQTFSYRTPAADDALKQISKLCASENMRASIQVIQKDFKENLHSHRRLDGLWSVLRGPVRFFGPDNLPMGEFGPLEGIFTPRGTKYR